MPYHKDLVDLFKKYGFKPNEKSSMIDRFIRKAIPEQKDKMLYDLFMLAGGALEQEDLWKAHAEKLFRDTPRPNY